MNILVIGASGKTGKWIVRECLKSGHTVTALVRDPASYTTESDRVHVASGTPMEPTHVAAAMQNIDAVIVALGMQKDSPKNLFSHSMENIIAAMKTANVSRIIVLSAAGAGSLRAHAPFALRMVSGFGYLKLVFNEHATVEKLLATSDLRYTIIKPTILTNKDEVKTLVLTTESDPVTPARSISRRQVADAIVWNLADLSFVGQSVIVSAK